MRTIDINRRLFLKSTGALLALPALETFAQASGAPAQARFAFFYVPYGVALAQWIPADAGRNYTLSPTLKPLANLKSDFSVCSGMHYLNSGIAGNHDTLDSFLTGSPFTQPRQSIDQMIADQIGDRTYLKSLVMSTAGGVGTPSRSSTLSYNLAGAPIPADTSPRAIFDKLFPPSAEAPRAALAERLVRQKSVQDMVRDDTHSLMKRIGSVDRKMLDEYLSCVRDVERSIQNQERLLNSALDPEEERELQLHASPSNNPEQRRIYVRTMFDLIFLGFRANMTNVATYAISDETADDALNSWPEYGKPGQTGGQTWHGFAHESERGNSTEPQASVDKWMIEQLGYLLQRLKDTREGERSLLDCCMVLYGSGNGITHIHRNLPLLLAGGSAFGLRHGQHVRYQEGSKSMASLLLTMVRQAVLRAESFAGASEPLAELI